MPALLKMEVEKKKAALMPDSCCAIIIMTAMTSGRRSDEVVTMARSVTLGCSFMASCSARISSNSA